MKSASCSSLQTPPADHTARPVGCSAAWHPETITPTSPPSPLSLRLAHLYFGGRVTTSKGERKKTATAKCQPSLLPCSPRVIPRPPERRDSCDEREGEKPEMPGGSTVEWPPHCVANRITKDCSQGRFRGGRMTTPALLLFGRKQEERVARPRNAGKKGGNERK